MLVYSNDVDDKSETPALGLPLKPIYPKTCAWLGELKEIVIDPGDGTEEKIKFTNRDLWVWDDMITLMALPKRGKIKEVLIWAGGKLKVTPRGIEH